MNRKDFANYIRQLKLKAGCRFCGYNACARALTFHHVTDNKEFPISDAAHSGSPLRILREIDKCVVLCANCHHELQEWGEKEKELRKFKM